ncbi:MAG: helix-hairpin-helix domain-containing protein, partial [Desulfobacterales bacterium]
DKDSRPKDSIPFEMPGACPVCGHKVERKEDEAVIRCVNIECPAMLKAKVRHFACRDAYDIQGFGDKLADQLVDEGILTSVADIFHLTEKQVAKMERMGPKSAKKLIEAIKDRKNIPLHRFLYGLGIPHLGRSVSKLLADRFECLSNIEIVEYESLILIEGIGPEIAAAIKRIADDPAVVNLIDDLVDTGVEIINPEKPAETMETAVSLEGKKFVITGTMSEPRNVIKRLIEDQGGKVSGSISRKTDYLVVGEKTGSKFEKAMYLGVDCISEDELREMIAM